MRILIIGASGMLGHKLYQRLGELFDVFGTVRSDFPSIERFGIFDEARIVGGVDADEPESLRQVVEKVSPECVINAAGVIKQIPTGRDIVQNLTVNSILPQRLAGLADEFGFRLITTGTDCVFNGAEGNYSEDDPPDARDIYGLSKLLGEVTDKNCLTLRTSIIGRELGTRNSFIEWFLANRGGLVKGYVNAIYTGFPTYVLADIIADLLINHSCLSGLYHVSSEPISKFALLNLVNEYFDANVVIEPFEEYKIDRSLDSTKFRRAVGFQPPNWGEMVRKMAADPTPYDAIHLANR